MKFLLLHRAVKGTPVVSLDTITRAVHIRLLARQIHNARILPTVAASRLARLRRIRPRAAVDPSPPTITRTTTSFATEVSPAWTPNTLTLIGHQNRSAIYSCQCRLIRETCLDSSSLIDWLLFWLMDFVAPSLCEQIVANRCSYMNCWNSFSCSWCYNFCTVNSWTS
jgi:hypothetical protein